MAGTGKKLKVQFTGDINGEGKSSGNVHSDGSNNQDIKLAIKVTDKGRLEPDSTSGSSYNDVADSILSKLQKHSVTEIPSANLDATNLKNALNDPDVKRELGEIIANIINAMYGATVADKSGSSATGKDITIEEGSSEKLEVQFKEGVADQDVRKSESQVVQNG